MGATRPLLRTVKVPEKSRPETCIWFQWSQIYEAWYCVVLEDYEAAETLILNQYQYQLENSSSENPGSFMLASTLKCLRTLRLRQQLPEESLAHCAEALRQFVDSVGLFTYGASLIICLERAMKWFSTHSFYAPEVTFVTYQMAILQKARGNSVLANEYMAKTENLYARIEPSYNKKRWLSKEDINSLLVLTSR